MAVAGSGPPWRGALAASWGRVVPCGLGLETERSTLAGVLPGIREGRRASGFVPGLKRAAATCPGDTFGAESHPGQNPLLECFRKCLVLSQHRLSWGSHSPLHEDPGRLARGGLSTCWLRRLSPTSESLGSRPGPSPIRSCRGLGAGRGLRAGRPHRRSGLSSQLCGLPRPSLGHCRHLGSEPARGSSSCFCPCFLNKNPL